MRGFTLITLLVFYLWFNSVLAQCYVPSLGPAPHKILSLVEEEPIPLNLIDVYKCIRTSTIQEFYPVTIRAVVLVDNDGNFVRHDIQLNQRFHYFYIKALEECVCLLRFKPAQLRGYKVSAWLPINFNFRLR
jgi:hypothetical protein